MSAESHLQIRQKCQYGDQEIKKLVLDIHRMLLASEWHTPTLQLEVCNV